MQVRTTAYSEAARECDDSPVAFEVDTFDEAAALRLERADARPRHLDFAAPAGDHDPDVWAAAHGPCGYGSRSTRSPVAELQPRRLSAAQGCGCLVAKIAAWVRLVSPSLASIEET